jgi:phenylacetate-CoA ligase
MARTDDMVNIRGVNVYPTTIESVVRGFAEITEFRSTVSRAGALRSLSLEIELAPSADAAATTRRVAQFLRDALGLTVAVHGVAPGTLPRFEMKARRFVVEE